MDALEKHELLENTRKDYTLFLRYVPDQLPNHIFESMQRKFVRKTARKYSSWCERKEAIEVIENYVFVGENV